MQLLAPLAPHVAEEMWSRLGQQGFVSTAKWPEYNPAITADDVVTMAVQVNGKTRGTLEISVNAAEDDAMAKANALNAVKNALEGKNVAKIIYKPGKILNIIAK